VRAGRSHARQERRARSDDLYRDKFSLLPASQRIFIQAVQQINGWRDRPKSSPPASLPKRPSARRSWPNTRGFQPIPLLNPPRPRHIPLYTPSKPLVYPL